MAHMYSINEACKIISLLSSMLSLLFVAVNSYILVLWAFQFDFRSPIIDSEEFCLSQCTIMPLLNSLLSVHVSNDFYLDLKANYTPYLARLWKL